MFQLNACSHYSNEIVGPSLLEDQGKPGHFYNWLGNYLKNELKPKAIVIISAHWQGQGKNGIFGMYQREVGVLCAHSWPTVCTDTYFASGNIRQTQAHL